MQVCRALSTNLPNVSRNLIGNFVGRGIGAALSLVLVPVYVQFLGVESYGLVAFYLTLQTLFGVLDLGLSTTTHREIAIRVSQDERQTEARDLLRTVEAIYWPIGLAIGLAIMATAPLIAGGWLDPATLSVKVVQTAIVLMGMTAALQWPYSLYEGVFHGLQRIVEFNVLAAGMQVLRGVGAVFVVWRWPAITAFFAWQAVISAATVALLGIYAWRYIPGETRPVVRMRLIREVWRFAAGMMVAAALATVLSHLDRVVLSRMLSLESFGYYGIASTVAVGLLYLMAPISLTVLPRFTELLAKQQYEALMQTYHLSSQLMTVVVTPIALVLALFSREVILLWTRNAEVAARTSTIASILILAMLLYTIMDVPYMMQLAQGRARLAVATNLVAVAVYVPLLVVMVRGYGSIGGALALVALQGAKFLIWGHVVHTGILVTEKWRWYLADVARPALAAAAVAVAARLGIPHSAFATYFVGVLVIVAIVGLAAVAALATAPLSRERALSLLPRLRPLRIDP